MSYVEKYKRGLALVLGTICLIVGLFRLGKLQLGLLPADMKFEDVWSWGNVIFIGLGIIFLWAEIAQLAKSVQEGASRLITKKTE